MYVRLFRAEGEPGNVPAAGPSVHGPAYRDAGGPHRRSRGRDDCIRS